MELDQLVYRSKIPSLPHVRHNPLIQRYVRECWQAMVSLRETPSPNIHASPGTDTDVFDFAAKFGGEAKPPGFPSFDPTYVIFFLLCGGHELESD